MCLNPQRIPNPNYSRQQVALSDEGFRYLDKSLISREQFIEVPCGTCNECRNTYYNSILQRGIVESISSYVYFITLTYDDKHIPSVTLPNGKVIYYSDYTHIQNLFKRLRKHKVIDRDFRYLVALEYGDKRHRPHFHLLLFVARSSSDDTLYPYNLERILFDNIKLYYSENIGTYKHPVYESLFTYRIRYTSQGVKTNYFVKYVDSDLPDYATITTDTTTHVKTFRYLISYINKGSSFDKTISKYLDDIHDTHLKDKLRHLLRSKIRYSKGFGLGFEDNKKIIQGRSYIKFPYLSYLYYSSELPYYFRTLIDLYPDFVDDINLFLSNLTLIFGNYNTLKSAVSYMNEEHLFVYVLLLTYFPNFITYIYKRFYRHLDNDNISYHFKFLDRYKYSLPKYSYMPIESNYVSKYIRKGLELGFNSRVPFLAFPLYSSNSFMSLCKFYKERYTDDSDIFRLYQILGVKNFDEWQDLFLEYCRDSKSSLPQGNLLLRESDILPQFVNNCNKNVKNLYKYLFVK